MKPHDQSLRLRADLRRDAFITIVAVVLAFLALDDITTDNARSFLIERTALAACAGWFVIVASRLLRQRHWGIGALSLGLIAAAALAQRAIGPGTAPFSVASLATVGGLAWFAVLSGILVRLACRPGTRTAA